MLAYPMRRTTVKLPEELDARLRREAERRGTTVSALVRHAIEQYLGVERDRRRLPFVAVGRGGGGVAERIDEILRKRAREADPREGF